MSNKEVELLKLELVSSNERQMTEPALREMTHQETEDTVPSPFTDSFHGLVFETDAWRDRRDELWQLVTEGDTVAVIEGEKGAGKTTFLNWFLSHVPDDWGVCHIAARMALGEKHVLARLGQALFSEAMADRARIAARLVERGRRGPFTVIVVDDADRLSVFAIKALFDLKRTVTTSGGRIGVVLAARPFAVETMFATPSLNEYRKDWLTSMELPHLTESETADYVRHRVETARLSDRLSFDETQLRHIYKGSHGVPLYINHLAKDMLAGARPRRFRTERQQHRLSRRRKTAIATAVLAVPLILLGYAFYSVMWKPSSFDLALEDAVLRGGLGESEAVPPPDADAVAPEAPAPEAPAPEAPAPSAPAPSAADASAADASAADASAADAGTVVADGRTGAVTVQPVKAVRAPEPVTVPETSTATGTANDSAAAGSAEVVASVGGATGTLTGNAWLLAQDPEGYTIQLAGTPEEAKAHEFIDKYPLRGDIAAVRTVRGGRTWYMVLYNSYPTLAAARDDINRLPPEVRRNQPFARRFASVQSIAAE